MLRRLKDYVLVTLAKLLRPYLARQHVIWGDPSKLIIGKNVVLVDAILNLRSGKIIIEDDVFFGHGVMVLTGKHSISERGIARQRSVPDSGRDVVIRTGAWIASGAIIIGPCEIGQHAVIGAGSVVTGNVPAAVIYSGNPAKFIRNA